jgi:hypothetical protein
LERRATSNRIGGRHHSGFAGDFTRNQHTARPELAKWCSDRGVTLHVFAWEAQHEAAGLARDALYLLRPDTYVALADASGAPDTVDRYCNERGLWLAAERAPA